MGYLCKSIKEIHEELISGAVTPEELVREALTKAHDNDDNAFEYICDKEAYDALKDLDSKDKNNLFWGIPFVCKDNFSSKDIPTCGSSNILNGYVPIFDSEVISRLKAAGAILIGKTTLDELAMGGSGTTGHLGATYNPWDTTHTYQIGGSSCGSAASVAAGIVPFSIGSDTGDSVRKPAGFGAMVGVKPTWGRISRYGLFPFAPSMDHVGFFTRNVFDSAALLEVLAGRDDKDSTSSNEKVNRYTDSVDCNLKGKKIAVIKEIFDSITNKDIRDAFENNLKGMANAGAVINYVSMDIDLLKGIYPTYIVISCAEATSNNANLDGIKFGPRMGGDSFEEVMMNARSKGFSELIKRRFIIGSYSLMRENQKELFLRAQKVRRLIVNAVNDILKDNDGIYLPSAPSTAPLIAGTSGDKLSDEYLIADNFMAIGNFGGLPSITLPLGFSNGMPFGANLTCKIFDETTMFSIASGIERVTGLKDLSAKGGK